MREASVLLMCFGEGGHHAQARRFIQRLKESPSGLPPKIVSLTDKSGIALDGTPEIVFAPLREKHSGPIRAVGTLLKAMVHNLKRTVQVMRLRKDADDLLFVSFGPAFALLPALIVKLLGGRVVHIETWSRFRTYSVTGRLMYRVAHYFLVQNEELLYLYPRATYCGRL